MRRTKQIHSLNLGTVGATAAVGSTSAGRLTDIAMITRAIRATIPPTSTILNCPPDPVLSVMTLPFLLQSFTGGQQFPRPAVPRLLDIVASGLTNFEYELAMPVLPFLWLVSAVGFVRLFMVVFGGGMSDVRCDVRCPM